MNRVITVLLADDHAVVRRGIRQFLERDPNIRVLAEAENGAQALEMARELKPDVLVLDIQMPVMTGIEVMRKARAEGRPCGLMALSAYDDRAFVLAALAAGANGYVLKTAEPDEIIQAVREVEEGKRVVLSAAVKDVAHRVAIPALTPREQDTLGLLADGLTNRAIAIKLDIGLRTVDSHVAAIFEKLGAQTRTEAARIAREQGLVAR
jgi:DNA-binding NarL/FixJ family response regulator